MSEIENGLRRSWRWLVIVQGLAFSMAIAFQFDLLMNPHTVIPSFFTPLIGAGVGIVFGLLASFVVVRRLNIPAYRTTLPAWLGMPITAVFAGGLLFYGRAALPMDWRPVVAMTLLGTLPGLVVGGRVSRWVSRDIIAAEPVPLSHPTLLLLNSQLAQVRAEYPGADGVLYMVSDDVFTAQMTVPRTREALAFYVSCGGSYPRTPPSAIAVELVLGDGTTRPITYDAPIVHYWNSKYGLRHIVQEALQILVH